MRRYWHIVYINRQKVAESVHTHCAKPNETQLGCVLGVCRLDVPYLRHRPCAKPSPIQSGLLSVPSDCIILRVVLS